MVLAAVLLVPSGVSGWSSSAPSLDAAGAGAARDLLPDLRPKLSGFYLETLEDGTARLRVGSSALNYGEGPFQLLAKRSSTAVESMIVKQRIMTEDGVKYNRRTGGVLEYAGLDGHAHWHLQHFISMELYDPLAPGTVHSLTKVGFCLIDEDFRRPDLPGASSRRQFYGQTGCGFPDSLRLTPGFSVGWADVYPADFSLQWIDLPSDLPAGTYRVCGMVDAEDQFLETRETNNWIWRDLHIDVAAGVVTKLGKGKNDCRPEPPTV